MLFLTGLPAFSSSNPEWFTRVWQTDDGLIDNDVNAIVQGPDDYLWLVTPVGLMQFDGVSFNPFPIEDFTGPGASHVRIIFCSREGVLWMGSDRGNVIGLNPDFSTVPSPQKNVPARVPQGMAEDGDGALWLGYPNLICRVKDDQVTRFGTREGVPPGLFHSLKSDGTGNIWLAQGNQISVFQNGGFHPIASLRGMLCSAAADSNTVWIVSDAHLFSCNTDGVLRDYGAFQNASGPPVTALLEDHDGAVWIGTDGNGLFRYGESNFERIGTSHSSILSIAEDREGNIWAGTAGGGLDRVSLAGVHLEIAGNNQIPSQIQSICQSTNGVLWGATQDGSFISRINNTWKTIFTNEPFNGFVTCVAADQKGAVWIGTRNGELLCLINTNYTTWETNVAHGAVHGLLPASNGDLWIVGENVLQRLHEGTLQNLKLPKQVQRIYAITEDAAGNIWIGANGILLRFDGKKLVNETPGRRFSDRPICCLYGTPSGALWIGSRGGGLVRFKDGHFSRVGVEQGLPNNYISQIVADGCGWLWFGSNHGIFKIQQQELERAMEDHTINLRPIVYGKNEGLASQEAVFSTDSPSTLLRGILSRDGKVWMLMHAGVMVADPKLLPTNSTPPSVLLTQVTMDGQTIASYGGVSSVQSVVNLKTLKTPLRLPPSYRHLEFDFTAFHFSAPENIRFRYQLAGFDTNWIDAASARSADYSRLTAGDYQFYVEASVGDGPLSQAPATLALVVTPFFWQTWWFRVAILVFFTLSMIAIVRYISFRRLQFKLHSVKQQAAVERERGRIARDIHDDLGNRLTEIQLLTGLAQRGRATPEKAATHVQEISSAARQATDALDEIVWAINPRNDTLPHLINYLGQFTADFMRTAGIHCRVDLPEHPPVKAVSAEVRHNLFLAVKESLNNVVRHANATEVSLTVLVNEDSLSVIMEDNGQGFNGHIKSDGADGLENMRRRIIEIGGQFKIESKPGNGTRISFNGLWLDKK